MPNPHQPVLLAKTIELLKPSRGEVYLDLTAGYGGHAAAVQALVGGTGQLTLVDRDEDATTWLKQHFSHARILNQDFAAALVALAKEGQAFDMILMDLGTSSPQLENAKRGFSFKGAGPIDMRMDRRQSFSAADLVNHADEAELADLIFAYGQERASRRIARAIVRARPIADTSGLAQIVASAMGGQRGKIHPATRTFQALRIATNQELEQLAAALPLAARLLKPGGRMVVISFHSLEDRMVKHWLKSAVGLEVLTKKPLAGKIFDTSNPRARSAKLRAAVKLKQTGESYGHKNHQRRQQLESR